MMAQIIHSGDLHLKVHEGLIAHLTRAALSLVGGHTVSELVPCKEPQDDHHACSKTLLTKLGPQLPHLDNLVTGNPF